MEEKGASSTWAKWDSGDSHESDLNKSSGPPNFDVFMTISNSELWKRISWVPGMSLVLPVRMGLSFSVSHSETIEIPNEIRWSHLRRCLFVKQVGASPIVLTVWAEESTEIQLCLFSLLPNRITMISCNVSTWSSLWIKGKVTFTFFLSLFEASVSFFY